MASRNNTKILIIATAAILFAGYRIGVPWIEQTNDMRRELQKINQDISDIRLEASQYDKAWEEKMKSIEETVRTQLPDSVNSSDVLDYFLARFEKSNTGHVGFISVSQGPPTMANFVGQNASVGIPRIVKYHFEAQMNQNQVVPYLEHIEKFVGLLRLADFSFNVDTFATAGLKMEMNLEFYLAPKEWALPDPLLAKNLHEEPEKEKEGNNEKPQLWQQIFLSAPVKESERNPAGATQKTTKELPKIPQFDRLVGDSIVSNESLYEEGDKIEGWRIKSIDSKARTITLQSGEFTRTVAVPK